MDSIIFTEEALQGQNICDYYGLYVYSLLPCFEFYFTINLSQVYYLSKLLLFYSNFLIFVAKTIYFF